MPLFLIACSPGMFSQCYLFNVRKGKNLENSLSYGILYKLWKKARVYNTLSMSRVGSGPRAPPPGFATAFDACNNNIKQSDR